MKAWQKYWLVAGLGLATLLPAQEAGKVEAGAAERPVAEWVEELGSTSFKERVKAEEMLRKLGQQAIPALEKAAETSKDSEIQWRARRLIVQIENGPKAGGIERRQPQDPRPQLRRRGDAPKTDVRNRFEDVFKRMEREFGFDIPRRRFFQDDFFRDLDTQFREMEQRMRALQQGGGGQVHGMQQGMSMQIGPNGVRVEVQEKNEKGETETKVYEAPDMDTFKKQYPDVLGKNGLGLDLDIGNAFGRLHGRLGPARGLFDLDSRRDVPEGHPFRRFLDQGQTQREAPKDFDDFGQLPIEAEPPASHERLGVYIKPEIAPAVREYLGLAEGEGLMVESVQEGALAQRLGVQAGDIVIRIGDTTIGSPADVRAALGGIEAGAEVAVKFVRKGRTLSATAKKPATAPAEEKVAPEQAEPPRPRIQRRVHRR